MEVVLRERRFGPQPRRRAGDAARRAALVLVAAVTAASCRHDGDDEPRAEVAPLAQADLARTRPGTAVDVDALANDGDADRDSLTIQLTSLPANATIAVTSQNLIRVEPADGFVGRIELEYVARDAAGAVSAPARVTVLVEPTARSLLSAAGAFHLADTRESQMLGDRSGCGDLAAPEYSAASDQLVLMTCDTSDRHQLIAVHPRAPALQAPVVLVRGAYVLSTMVLSDDGRRLVTVSADPPRPPRRDDTICSRSRPRTAPCFTVGRCRTT